MPDSVESTDIRLNQQVAALDAFVRFTEVVGSSTGPFELAREAINVLDTRFHDASVAYYELENGLWKAKVYSDNIPAELLAIVTAGLPSDLPVIAEVLRTREPSFIDGWKPEQGGVEHSEVYGATALYPLIVSGEVRALLSAGLKFSRRWSQRDKAVLRAVGKSLTLALERAATSERLVAQNAELEARTRALEAFASLTRDLSQANNLQTLVRIAQDVVLSMLPEGYAVFFELHGDTWRLTVQSGDLRNPALQAAVDAGLPYASAGNLITPWTTRQAFYQDEYDTKTDNLEDLVAHVGTTATLPVLVGGVPVGVFAVALFDTRRWAPIDRAVLETVVRNLGIAAEGVKGAEQLLERTREVERWRQRYEVAVRGSGHLLYDWDPATDVIVYGGAAESITGYTTEELAGNLQDWTERLVHPEDRAAFLREVARVVETGDAFRLEFRLVRKDGSVRDVEDEGYFMRDDQEQVTRLVGLVKDVTERRQTLAALRRSNAELEQFAHIASHDLQAPIRAVTSFADVLARRYGAQVDERGQMYLRQIAENGEHMKRLLDDLLTYSRVTSEQRPFVQVNANLIFDAVVSRLAPETEALGAQVTREDLPTVLADAQQLDQLLQNLVSNALKYRREGVAPVVRLTARRDGMAWRFALRDNGIGIEHQYFERIFQMFQRLHGRGQFEGTGVGLAVCQKIVARHDGRLWVESSPGKGSTFLFTLPGA
ncbi:sensor histidine kinase [Deinococcus peraridilitoris]|uniref:histidine kinase n=1 Tax=Deinococcus peraridilitoris (strain DSM 19664 / LMG 22246 / CIP 109416 / KR-200) TaxID=937777 RepID=L0A0V6_DEIPD|nr:PAS domain-containing sensor histidine kinase [Deinococcus peraridilitoris]AFZ66615.1 PAS domain S-box [Deinococcus peraridilitoris DSM 19664]